jgi:hypothetical protein
MTAKYAIRAGSTGIHLFDRQSGTNILCDEVIVPPSLWSRCPRQVSIALTNACDLRCAFCYAPKISAGLDNTIVSRWLVELSDHGCLGVGFGGGDPRSTRSELRSGNRGTERWNIALFDLYLERIICLGIVASFVHWSRREFSSNFQDVLWMGLSIPRAMMLLLATLSLVQF